MELNIQRSYFDKWGMVPFELEFLVEMVAGPFEFVVEVVALVLALLEPAVEVAPGSAVDRLLE